MKTKFFLVFLFSVIIFASSSFSSNVVLANTLDESESKTVIVHMTEEEIDEEHKRQIDEELLKLKTSNIESEITPFNEPSDYKTEYGTRVTRSVEGFAGNQPSGGVKFPTGGGFYHSDSGGPTATINVSFPEPYAFFSLSVPLGNSSTSGYFVNAPNKTDYFKLSVIKTYSIQPYVTYQKTYDYNSHTYYWKVITKNHTKTHVSSTVYAKKVN